MVVALTVFWRMATWSERAKMAGGFLFGPIFPILVVALVVRKFRCCETRANYSKSWQIFLVYGVLWVMLSYYSLSNI